jgi:dihydrofolate reductase
MRKVIYGINLTADGCCDHTKGIASEEIHRYFTELLHDVDLIVYGRITYELMVPYWPEVAMNQSGSKTTIEFAQTFDSIPKIVFSRTLARVPAGTRIIRDNLADEVLKLKQQPGKNISIGGVDLPSQLIALGLVDEFYFVIQPVLAGEGRRLLADTQLITQSNLKLVECKTLKDGAVALHYQKQ